MEKTGKRNKNGKEMKNEAILNKEHNERKKSEKKK